MRLFFIRKGLKHCQKLWQNIVWAAYSLQISQSDFAERFVMNMQSDCKDFAVALKITDVIYKKQMLNSVITGEKKCFQRLELYYNYIDVSDEF